MTLTFFTNPQSRGQIVRWMLEEVGEPYETELLTYGGTMREAPYRAINPMMKVPAIRHGERVVTEVAAICAYLADAFPAASLAPPLAERADYYRFFFFAAGPIEQVFSLQAIQYDPPADKQAMFGHGSRDRCLTALDQMLGDREYVTGRFSAADLYLSSQLGFMMMFDMFEPSETVRAYVARCTGRPGYARAKQRDEAAKETMPA